MNVFQFAKLGSYKMIVVETRNNMEAANLIPMFFENVNRLEVLLNEIDSLSVKKEKDLTGIAAHKSDCKDELCCSVLDVSGAIYAYAMHNNNKELAHKVNFKESVIGEMSNAKLILTANIVIDEVRKLNPGELNSHGITPDEITHLENVYSIFKEINSAPREAIIDRSGYTQQLNDLFAQAADLKKNTLDRLATQFQRKAPDFYTKYKAASTVIYRRSTKNDTPTDAKAQ